MKVSLFPRLQEVMSSHKKQNRSTTRYDDADLGKLKLPSGVLPKFLKSRVCVKNE